MRDLFLANEKLNDVDSLADWNTSCVTDMSGMFGECLELVDIIGLSKWDIGKVVDMNMMFYACDNLGDISGINDWNISNVIDFEEMFHYCPSHPEFAKRPGTWDDYGTFTSSI